MTGEASSRGWDVGADQVRVEPDGTAVLLTAVGLAVLLAALVIVVEPMPAPVRGMEGINPKGGPMENCQKPSDRLSRRILRLVVILAGTVLAATSCGGDDGGSAATTPSPATSAATEDADTGTVINVDERDFMIELSTMELTPGTYTFVTTNNGQTTHALEIEGQGLEEETADLAPGDSAELTVTLEAGEYEIYCPVGNHKDMGMKLDITVE